MLGVGVLGVGKLCEQSHLRVTLANYEVPHTTPLLHHHELFYFMLLEISCVVKEFQDEDGLTNPKRHI